MSIKRNFRNHKFSILIKVEESKTYKNMNHSKFNHFLRYSFFKWFWS